MKISFQGMKLSFLGMKLSFLGMKESFRGVRRSGDIKTFKGQKNLFSMKYGTSKHDLTLDFRQVENYGKRRASFI
jgi:hypothetical protein